MSIRVRFAPSPTGHVHIGNIRAAIFNWLFARHEKGTFILRVEDTDLERSTAAAIQTLLESMDWLGLTYDEEILYQTSQASKHDDAAKMLIQQEDAYYGKFDAEGGRPIFFRIPWDLNRFPCVRKVGEVSLDLHPDVDFEIDFTGVSYAQMSRKGKPMEEKATLAGFEQLKLYNAENELLFILTNELKKSIKQGEVIIIKGATKATFIRHEVFYHDLVKGELAKPLDTVRDFVIVRSNGSPIFHIANVVDDITQEITHIIRGDDHVENTYRHLFLFHTLGVNPPAYAHLPMIVNNEGKPYSKRDGDAFVGDFKTKGYLADALVNYLALLGWSSPDGKEELNREELIERFTLGRVSSAPAKLDMIKLQSINMHYLNKLSDEAFFDYAWSFAQEAFNLTQAERTHFEKVALLMRSRTRCGAQIKDWIYFFTNEFPIDEKAVTKTLSVDKMREGLQLVANQLSANATLNFHTLLRECEKTLQLDEGKLNPIVRLALTGVKGGADLDATYELIGPSHAILRLLRTSKI